MSSGSNLTVLPLTVPTTGLNKLSPKSKSVLRNNEYECPSYEKSLHSSNHHKRIGYLEFIWKYTSIKDRVFYILGITVAIITGSVIPIININFGNVIDIYIQHDQHRHLLYDTPKYLDSNVTTKKLENNLTLNSYLNLNSNITIPAKLEEFKERSYSISFNILAIGFIYFFLCYIYSVLLELGSSHMIERIRVKFYKILFEYETIKSDPITGIDYASRMENVICKLEEWTGESLGLTIYMISCCFFSLVSALYHGWELTLVLLALIPVLSLATTFITKTFNQISNISNEITYKIANLVHKVIDSIRIVFSYNNQLTQEIKFNRLINTEMAICRKKVYLESFMTASLWLTSYLTFALGVWYAAKLIIVSRDTSSTDDDKTYTIGSIIIIFWNVLSVTYFTLRIRSNLNTFYNVPFHASTIVSFIDSTSHNHQKGLRPASFNASIRFDNVSYTFQLNPGCSGCSGESTAYLLSTSNDGDSYGSTLSSPFVGSTLNSNQVRIKLPKEHNSCNNNNNKLTRKEQQIQFNKSSISSLSEILENVSFTVKEEQTVTILGEPGSGISIFGKLLCQFFTLNHDIKGEIYLGDNCIESLNREWVKSIIGYVGRDAIIYDGTISQNIWLGDKSCTHGDIVKACERANIAKLVESLPQSYETIIGSKGITLKKSDIIRLALARALVKRPKILVIDQVFDKITDLDELADVVLAIEKARIKLTTIIITSTITKNVKNSDLTVVIDRGQVIELGSHDDLFARKGLYKQMYLEQVIQQEDLWIHRQNELNDKSSLPETPDSAISQETCSFSHKVQTCITSLCDETVNQVIHEVMINQSTSEDARVKSGDTFVVQVTEPILKSIDQQNERRSSSNSNSNEVTVKMKNDEKSISIEDVKEKKDEDEEGKEKRINNDTSYYARDNEIGQSIKQIYRSPSVRSSISVISSESRDETDEGESEFYRQQRSKSVVEAKFAPEYTYKFLLQFFDVYDWFMLLMGALSSAIFGVGVPVYALIVGEFMTILEYKTADAVLCEAKYVALQFMILSLVISIASFTSYLTLGFVHTSLTKKLKEKLFTGILALDLNWFQDKSSLHPYVLKTLFTNEINDVPYLVTSSVASYATLTGTIIMCIGYSCYSHWKLALVVLSLMPIIMFRSVWFGKGTLMKKKSFAHTKKTSVYRIIQTARGKIESSNGTTTNNKSNRRESIDLTHLLCEIKSRYEKVIHEQGSFQRSNVHVRAQTTAMIQCIPVLCYGIVYIFGTYFIQADSIHYTELFKIIEGVIFGAILVSEVSFFTLETQSIKNTAGLLVHLLNLFSTYRSSSLLSLETLEKSKITNSPSIGNGNDDDDDDDESCNSTPAVQFFTSTNGLSLELRNICYKLSNPPYTTILDNLTYRFQPNSYTAIYSFSFKTTDLSILTKSSIFSLSQKLLIPKSGTVLIDDRDIEGIPSKQIRQRISLITSDVTFLPDCTIGENIALGDPNRYVPMEEIINICTQLGINGKIQTLQNGYESKIINLGHQLNQVDKLLLMFARCAIQDPGIILLEQIDHGLSEGTFMTFIDPIIQRFRSLGKTIITIPCGLGSNLSYDTIILMGPNGYILELGSHEQLMSLGGAYFNLYHCYHS